MNPFFLPSDDKNCTHDKKVRIETYGCQMNVADSEVIATMMGMAGYSLTEIDTEAAAVIINTCSIRDNAEQKIISRLSYWNALRRKLGRHIIIGVAGCMAERVREKLISDHGVDLVAGPDSYLDLPNLVGAAETGNPAINIELSATETYRDIIPSRIGAGHTGGFISIMRGCNNFCSYCIVPYTRGRERSREPQSILAELADLRARGYKEATLLGQNVNSYAYTDPVSGRLNRKYTRAWYLDRIAAIRRIIPGCGISSDLFTGFHGETEEDFQLTLSLMREARFDSSFMFKYSERPGTYASKHLPDNVPEETKIDRLNRMIQLQNELSQQSNAADIGKRFEILVEGRSKRSADDLYGRTSQNKVVVFPADGHKPGEFVNVEITQSTSATLIGRAVD